MEPEGLEYSFQTFISNSLEIKNTKTKVHTKCAYFIPIYLLHIFMKEINITLITSLSIIKPNAGCKKFVNYFSKIVALSNEESEAIIESMQTKAFKKGEFFIEGRTNIRKHIFCT